MKTAIEFVDNEMSDAPYPASIHVFDTRCSGGVIAILLVNDDAGGIADRISQEDRWFDKLAECAWFPIGRHDTSYFAAIEDLKRKLATIPYSEKWLDRLYSVSIELESYTFGDVLDLTAP